MTGHPEIADTLIFMLRRLAFLAVLVLAACGSRNATLPASATPGSNQSFSPGLYPGETPEIRLLVNKYADLYEVPRPLVHRVIQRESDYRPDARNGPYFGMMQILPETASQMGFRGRPSDLLDAETNLKYAVKYLRGAWLVSDGDMDDAVMWYARGYYYQARDRCQLVETGLLNREIAKRCR